MSALSILCNERSGTIAMGHCGNYIYVNKSDICPLDWERDKEFESTDNIIFIDDMKKIFFTELSQVNIYQLACL